MVFLFNIATITRLIKTGSTGSLYPIYAILQFNFHPNLAALSRKLATLFLRVELWIHYAHLKDHTILMRHIIDRGHELAHFTWENDDQYHDTGHFISDILQKIQLGSIYRPVVMGDDWCIDRFIEYQMTYPYNRLFISRIYTEIIYIHILSCFFFSW